MIWWTFAAAMAVETLDPSAPGPVDQESSSWPIVGGEVAPPGVAPEVGALFVADLYGCTAVLVAPDLVLSAGHCWSATSLPKSVRLGASDHATDEGELVPVVDDWRMPDYLEAYDIALFALERPALAAPARLLRTCEAEDLLFDGARATILGYGATDLDALQTTTQLHQAMVTIEDADCSDLERGCRSSVSPGGELRAGGDGVDTCVGDSGGPLYVEGPDGPVLAGITSRSALPAPTNCGSGGLYVRVDAIVDWIEATSGQTLPAQPCDPPLNQDTAVGPADTGLATGGPESCGCANSSAPGSGLLVVALLSALARGRARPGCREGRPPRRG